ncbi:Methyl-CpG-binding domain protein 4 [Ranunculus cassubicifolius]
MKQEDKSRGPRLSVSLFAVQCGKCFKWRVIPTQEEYEEIRHSFTDDPFTCNKKTDTTCEEPADIEYDETRTWVVDKPNIPKTPTGFKRGLTLRRDYSRMDAYYTVPNGNKKVRAPAEVEKFLEDNPQYKEAGVSVSDFNFVTPKVMEDTIPKDVEVGSSAKRMKMSKQEEE